MPIKSYPFTQDFQVTSDVKDDFDKNGFVLLRGLLSGEEVAKIRNHLEQSDVIKKYSYGVDDGASRQSRMCLWNQPGSDLTGMVARSDKVAGTCDKLLGGEVYHYHTKLMQKEAHSGGRWAWHQDYGYWYKNTCLLPHMLTVFVALDPCNLDNGCLQVMPGSQRCGRLEHARAGGQEGAEAERVQQLQARFPPAHVPLEPGDALFFHCNLLHTSGQNNGPDRRWALAMAYNRADNDPVLPHHHPQYTKLHKVRDASIMAADDAEWDVANKDFYTLDGEQERFKTQN